MSDTLNKDKLKDVNIPSYKKLKTTFYLSKGTFVKIDSLISLLGENPSRNDVIEKAIDFYFGYLTSQQSQDYLCGAFGTMMEGLVGNLATRISRGNFRNAVEMNIITRILASSVHMDKATYERIRGKSVHDVKTLNGSIDIFDAFNERDSDDL